MKTKISMTLLPSIIGIVAVLGLLFIYNIIFRNGVEMRSSNIKFFTLFVPFTIVCALIIQYLLALPTWKKFKTSGKVFGMNLPLFTIMISLVGGLVFGLVFWERSYGINEFIAVTLTGIVAFAIYWAINIGVIKRLEKV
jgi:hypothetical protein